MTAASQTAGPTPSRPVQATRSLALALAIATTGRRDTLRLTLPRIALQTRAPDRVVLSVAGEGDVDREHVATLPFPVEIVVGDKGLCRQRNAAIAAVPDCDVVVFLDDDFLMQDDFLAETEALFASHPEVVVATGTVVADGILGPGIGFAEAEAALAADRAGEAVPAAGRRVKAGTGDGATGKGTMGKGIGDGPLSPAFGAYGCNMALRLAPMRAHGVRFDERLPLYGWLEDTDLSRRLGAHGRVVRSALMRGAHMGEKRGRSPGVKLGYSQIANPVYMARKGSLTARFALFHISRNIAKNLARAAWPEPWVDRRGRLRGNLIALAHLARRRLAPEKMMDVGR